MASERAKGLVALCKNIPDVRLLVSPVSAKTSADTEFSPVSSWWDDVFDASDIRKHHLPNLFCHPTAVKRKLSFSPQRETKIVAESSTSCVQQSQSLLRSFVKKNTPTDENDDSIPLISDGLLTVCNESRIKKSIKAPLRDSTSTPFNTAANYHHVPKTITIESAFVPVALSTTRCIQEPLHENPESSLPIFEALQPVGEEVDDIYKPPQKITETAAINDSVPSPRFAHILCNSASQKKPQYPSQQASYEAKLALNAGKQHLTSSGKIRRARCPQPACKLQCKRCSSPRLTEKERLVVCEQFWNLQNHEQQWLFIFKSIKLTAPKRKTSLKGAKGEKLVNREYCFCIGKEPKKVCKTMFKTTLNICDSWIVNALSHCSCDQVKIPDNRGRHKQQLAAQQEP